MLQIEHTKNKLIAKNTLFLYCRMLFIMFVTLFTSRILLKSLGVVDYGLNNVVGGLIVIFSYINASMSSATSRFITYELGKGKDSNLGRIFSGSLSIHLSLAIFVLVLGEVVGVLLVNNVLNIPQNRILACNILYQTVVISAFFTITQVPFNSTIIAYERMSVYAYIGIYDAITKLLIAYVVMKTRYDKLIVLAVLQLFASTSIWAFYVYYTWYHFRRIVSFRVLFDRELVLSMGAFTFWSLIGSTANMLKNQGVNVLINLFFGSIVNAANAIAYQVNHAVFNFSSNFMMAMNPQIVKSYAGKNFEQFKKLVFRGGKFSFFLLTLLCYPLLFETKSVLALWLGTYPSYTVLMTQLVLVLTMVESFTYSIGYAVQATGRIRNYQLVISGVTLMNFPISLLLFYLDFPPYTALAVSIIISSITLMMRMYFIDVLLNISPTEYSMYVFKPTFLVLLLTMPIPIIIVNIVEEGIFRFVILTLSVILFNSLIIFAIGMNTEERNSVLRFVRKKIVSNS